ncbi:hypothetical protein [Flavivirga jejuensis]|uniref:Lactobin A/cerein 7B family class IIb bacteriocin n=1 Tax=Flavivirga jejuensis TaxID=870487 RepID=A0ABT8WVH2_9FLAO|nr:hypothetical protein [Flavivirga jejuensis]MDO5977177.1 hypothetical protein [Flavivirga jejuensis]
MKNVENFGVQEMNAKQVKKCNGGIIVEINILFGLMLYGAYTKGYNDGYSA